MTISTILEQACGYSYFVVPRYVLVPRRPLLFSSRQRMQFYFGKRTVSGIAETRMFSFPSATLQGTTSAVQLWQNREDSVFASAFLNPSKHII